MNEGAKNRLIPLLALPCSLGVRARGASEALAG